MTFFSDISSGDPKRVQLALLNNISVLDERCAETTPHKFTVNRLDGLTNLLEKKVAINNDPVLIAKLRAQVNGLEEIVCLVRDATLKYAIDNEDISAIEDMIKIEPIMVGGRFKTGPLMNQFPIHYAEATGKTSVVNFFLEEKAANQRYFSSFSGAIFADRSRELNATQAALQGASFQHAKETRDARRAAASELTEVMGSLTIK
jgi:hypothetical protein